MVSTLIQASSTVRYALATLENLPDFGMGLVLLEQFIWVEVWVLIVKANYKSNMHKVGSHVIQERPTIHISGEWPVYSMLHFAWFEVRIVLCYSPHFLQTNAVMLHRNAIFIKVEILLDPLS
jgi:hypothetical protein